MDSITSILNNLNSFSKSNFKFSQYIESLLLLKHIPSSLSDLLNTDDFIYHLQEASSHIQWLTSYFDDHIIQSLKKEVSRLKKTKDTTIPYADFTIDSPPLFQREIVQQLSFGDILKEQAITPVKRRNPEGFTFQGVCPFCGAPTSYIYNNNKQGQLLCKCCKNTFSTKVSLPEQTGIYCPHCKCKLDKQHDRNNYIVYCCVNRKCSYYLNNNELHSKGMGEHLKTSSGEYRYRYHYREFKFNLENLKQTVKTIDAPVDLSRIHYDSNVLGLVLTYHVNFGLSSRKTALIFKQVHGISISHQTIMNYATSVSAIIKPMVDKYPYQLGSILSGDETYIKVRGKNHYVFFWSDPIKKIITSNTIYPVRDTKCACQSIYDCLAHYKEIPKDLLLIADGNPIYNAAQLFFGIHGISFDLQQVIGVKNKDETSKKYRPYKQIEERLNRTYKQNYHGTNGYDKLECANSYMTLFVAFHNFLRPHSSLGYKTPVQDDLFQDAKLMQDKWIKLIELSTQYHQA
ncbi:integrase core domain-containing protein [Tannockella kyphosi]|uniref:integrase core domain-containing protein n=1 Tax=Tannockella kyphosi TaxID=2899121 RepID=UPI00201187F1|nr:integrase core domain-containing protein [Tannockella kyphosi]